MFLIALGFFVIYFVYNIYLTYEIKRQHKHNSV